MASVNTIIIKNSAVTGKTPVASDLEVGELALNTADGLLFTKQADSTIIKIAGDNLSLTNEVVNDGAANEGAKINLINALASGNVNEGSFTIEGSSTVQVTHDSTNNKVVLSSGGGTVTGISSGGTTVNPASGVIDFVGGNGITVTANDGTDALTLAIGGADSSSNAVSGVKTYSTQQIFNAGLTTGNGATSAGFIHFLEDSTDGTNKVILQGASSGSDITLTLPVVTSTTLVGEAGAQTLTEKTLTAPTINGVVGGTTTSQTITTLNTSTINLGGAAITSTAAELNLLDGVAGLVQADFTKLAAVDATAAELNILDGDTSATSTTVADADRVVLNDNGTMVQVAVTDLAAYFDDEITAMPNLVATGALNSGTITSGFGNINNGASTITTTGQISGGALVVDTITVDGSTVTASGDLTLDSGGDIVLDADGANVTIKDAGASVLDIANSSGDVELTVSTADKNFAIKGTDGSSGITALDIDMALAGKATFNGEIVTTSSITGGSLVADGTTINNSTITDTGSNFKIDASGSINLDAAGSGAVGTISFADAGLNYGIILPSANDDFMLRPAQTDKDIILQGNDDGSVIDMLKLDASDAGNATFSGSITSTAGDVTITAGDLNITKSASEQAEINLFEATGAGTNKITVKPATATLGGDTVLTLPAETGLVITTASSNIVNANISGSAAIADSKLAKITTTDKVGAQSIDITSATDGSSGGGAFALADDDFFLVHDTGAGATKKVLMSQLETYVGIGAGGLAITAIDIDGGQDINADLVDGDLFIVDDGANGTNRKSAISRIGDYIFNKISTATATDISITDAGVATINPNSVAMGTDTTGNYVATIAVGSNLQTTGASTGETIAHTINLATNPDIAGTLAVTGDVTMDASASVAGNLTVTGNLEVNGTTTTVNTDNLSVEDSLIELARGNTSDTLDVGFFGNFGAGSDVDQAGLVRDADHGSTVNGVTLPKPFVLFTDHDTTPDSGTVNFTGTEGTDWSYAPLAVGHISLGASGAAGTAHIKRLTAGSGSLANIVGEIKHFKIDGGTY